MKTVRIEVNGTVREVAAESRTSLADLLRDDLHLTGTHLGCEQGVCGACTIHVDGRPARACLALAVATEDRSVRTIEGFDDDPLMAELRTAFREEHALQCGFCTPGMLITAHDIVHRLPDADETRVRLELGGNLCRCTGYVGIVRAVLRVLDARRAAAVSTSPRHDVRITSLASVEQGRRARTSQVSAPASPTIAEVPVDRRLSQSLTIAAPRGVVWNVLLDTARVVRCIPGATLVEISPDGSISARMNVRLGPIGTSFVGKAGITRDEPTFSGAVDGRGQDRGSGSRASARIVYRLSEENHGQATRVDVEIDYQLSGILAQVGRRPVVAALADAIIREFAENLGRSLQGDAEVGGPREAKVSDLVLARLFWKTIQRALPRWGKSG